MLTTTRQDVNATITQGGKPAAHKPNELVAQYQDILTQRRLSWTNHLQLRKLVGSGGQGVVYQTELRGTDDFTLPAALKIFSPERFDDVCSYDEAMQRVARASARVAQIQHDNLIDVQNFIERRRVRIQEMEWVDGYDLDVLLYPVTLERAKINVASARWNYINDVIAGSWLRRTSLTVRSRTGASLTFRVPTFSNSRPTSRAPQSFAGVGGSSVSARCTTRLISRSGRSPNAISARRAVPNRLVTSRNREPLTFVNRSAGPPAAMTRRWISAT